MEKRPQDSEIIVTSHDDRYEFENCRRYEPLNNILEIDRFTEELIEDNMCFLYGDTYYTDEAIEIIINSKVDTLLFFGNEKSITAVKIASADEFIKHKNRVKGLFLSEKIRECKGWQIYQSFTSQDLNKEPQIGSNFVIISDGTIDINTPEDYRRLV